MPSLLDKLRLELNQTGLAKTNNPLFGFLTKLLSEIPAATPINYNVAVYNVDTRTAAVSIPILTVLKPGIFYIIKDFYGNAGTNNITLDGTVDGVVDPIMNTDYEIMRVYNTTNGFMLW